MKTGAEGPDAVVVPPQINPIGEQDYHLPQFQVNPKAGAGKARVPHAVNGKKPAGRALPRGGHIKTRGAGSFSHGRQKLANYLRGDRQTLAAAVIGPVEPDGQAKNL